MKISIEKETEFIYVVRYNGESEHELGLLFEKWTDSQYLFNFFLENKKYLTSYFHHVTVSQAADDTTKEVEQLETVLFHCTDSQELSSYFKPLNNSDTSDNNLSKKKGRLPRNQTLLISHDSWLRIYAIKIDKHIFLITGGAIKLTREMSEHNDTRIELRRLEQCRDYLLENGIFDKDSFMEFLNEQ